MKIEQPSKRQKEILDFIDRFRKRREYPPSLTEIAEHFSISVPTVHQHISYLKRKGFITTRKGTRRSIRILNNKNNDIVEIPLMGLIAAGGPIEAIRNPRPIDVPQSMLSASGNHYALKVTGLSMIEDGIFDGDIVIVREQPTVENGEKAVAYLPDENTVTLKKLYREKNKIKLAPANADYDPFYVTNIEVQGKVVGVLRTES